MKAVLIFFALVSSLTAQTVDRATVLSQIRTLAKEQQTQLDGALMTIGGQRAEILKLSVDLEAARVAKAAVDAQVSALNDWGVAQQARADAAEVAKHRTEIALQAEKQARAETLYRYHRLKLIAALIGAVVGVLLSLRLGGLITFANPYGALVPVLAGAAGFSLIWFLL